MNTQNCGGCGTCYYKQEHIAHMIVDAAADAAEIALNHKQRSGITDFVKRDIAEYKNDIDEDKDADSYAGFLFEIFKKLLDSFKLVHK